MPHWDGAKRTPIDLGTLARRKGQGEKGGLPPGSDGAYIGFDNGRATVKTLLTQALEDLGSRIGIPLQHADNLRFERIEFAGVLPWLAGAEVFLGKPVGHRARIER